MRPLPVMALALGVCLVGAPLAANAQPTAKAWRIGYLTGASPSPPGRAHLSLSAVFRQALRELGYVEGQHFTIEQRWAEGRLQRLPALAAELVTLKVDVIFASSGAAALAAKQATTTIPIVFAMFGDPLAYGLVASLSHPGGNLTGLGSVGGGGGEIAAKRLQLLKEVAPGITRVAVLWNPRNPGNVQALKVLTQAAGGLGVRILSHEVPEPAAVSAALEAMAKEQVGGLLIVADPTLTQHYGPITEFAAKNRLPAIYPERRGAEAGGLMSYNASLTDLNRRAAGYVDRILKGARPGTLPVELATRFELVINLKPARSLGLAIPPSLLVRADYVIE